MAAPGRASLAGKLAGLPAGHKTGTHRVAGRIKNASKIRVFVLGRPVLSWAPFLLKPMISLKCGLVDPLTGTQTRDTATVTYRMAPLYKDSDSSLWNFRTRTTFIARLIKGCRVDVRAGCFA
jgi:hypothetical protein